MDIDAERKAFDEWLPNYYTAGEDSAARSGWVAAIEYAESCRFIPEGYALVPIEPNKDMLMACEDAGSIYNHQRGKRIYQAMLRAAPVVTP